MAELDARKHGLWLETRGEILVYFDDFFAICVTIPDAGPFEPSRLNRIFDIAEDVIVKHIPGGIPIRDDGETWSVRIETAGDRAQIDAMHGGRDKPARNFRLSEGVGTGARDPARSSQTPDDMDAENPLWDYLSDKRALEELVAEGAAMHVSMPILDSAIDSGDADLVRLLLKAGGAALLHSFDRDLQWTPLMMAARNGDVAMTTFLLEAGSDVNAHDEANIGDTALMLAVEHGHYEVAEVLVRHGADPTIPGWMGRTPLDRARERIRMPELYALLKSAER